MAQKNSRLESVLHLKPMNLALGFGLAIAAEIYLLTKVAPDIFPVEELGQARLAIMAMTLIPLWVISYVIVSLITHKLT